MAIEDLIFGHLLANETYSRKVIPFLKNEYFQNRHSKIIFELIDNYIKTYHKIPTKEALNTKLQGLDNLTGDEFEACTAYVKSLDADLTTSIKIIDNKDSKRGKGSIPEILTDALSVSFDTNIGHDYLDDSKDRYEHYHTKEEQIEFDLEYFNKITKGGLRKKTLNIILASTGVGKTMFMAHCAAHHLALGKNVLYISMEMDEISIAERIDANQMDITIDELRELPRESFDKKINRIRSKTQGKLIVKEYPTGSANAAHFRHLLQELRIKRGFKPDIIYIDYLNICSSSRMKMGGSVNSYMYIKAIAEELRGLAQEFDVPIMSATQSNRDAYNSSDMGLDNTSESWGLPATADLMVALISTEELEDLNQIMVKQLKNRKGDLSTYRRFVIGINRSKMKFYDVEQSAQQGILDGPQQNDGGFTTSRARKDFSSLRMD